MSNGSVPSIFGGGQRPPSGTSDQIDFKIHGQEMQFVEIELDPGESAIAEAGGMMFKDPSVHMDTMFGDGSKAQQGFFGKIASAGKRLLTGESLFMTMFTQQGQGKARVAFASPYPGTILPFKLSEYGGMLIAQRDAFLCAAKGVTIGIHFQKKIMTGLFGGEGFIMQKPGRRRLRLHPRRRLRDRAPARRRRGTARRHRLRRRHDAVDRVRHRPRRLGQVDDFRRRGRVLRPAPRPRHGVDPEPAVLAPRRPRAGQRRPRRGGGTSSGSLFGDDD